MTRHVLLLNSDKPDALRAITSRPDIRLRVITRKCYAGLYPGCDIAFVDSFENLHDVEQAVYELARTGPIDHVVAATEKSVLAAGLVRSLLGLPGPGFDQSLWATHKRAMKQRLRAAGLPVTDFAQAATLADVPSAATRTGWPIMVKPVFGSGSRSTYRVDSAESFASGVAAGDFTDLAARRVPIQVERLVRFDGEFHCDAVVRDGTVRIAALCRYFAPPLHTPAEFNGSYFVDQESPFAREVLALNTRVVAALGLTDGVTHLEVFGTDAGPVLGEVAIRPGGLGVSRSWWHAYGIDLWDEFVSAALGDPAQPPHALRPGTVGRTQLPALDDIARRAAEIPGVIEVRTPRESGTGNVEVYFTAPDPAGVEEVNASLHALVRRPR